MHKVSAILKRKGNSTVNVSPQATVIQALELMAESNIGSVVVMDGEKFAGIITERDYSRKVILKGKNSSSTIVSDIMTADFPAVSPDAGIDECMELMTKTHIRYLPVFETEKLVGIISMSDVVKETILTQKETISQLESYIHR